MKKSLLSFALLASSMTIIAQDNDPVIMKINGKEIKKSEFEYIYNKNNNEEAFDKKTLNEYVDLFKKFKLKVAEAEAQGLDTTAVFHKELGEYRSQLAKPYMQNLPIDENLLKSDYAHTTEFIEISHIIVPFSDLDSPQNPKLLPADTIASYKLALTAYNKANKGGDFEALVKEYSGDKRAIQADRPGYMGWISGMQLIPVLENVVFDTPVGKVTKPIRSNFGYHIFKIHDKKSNPGEIQAAHILIFTPAGADTIQLADAKQKIDEIYARAIAGEDFATLAQENSQDGSASQGGDLGWFAPGRMVVEFNDAAFALKEVGDISKPVKTQFGYHIIKLLGKRLSAPYEDLKANIQMKLNRTGCSAALNRPAIENMKAENGFVRNETAYKSLLTEAQTIHPTDSLFYNQFKNDESVLFTVDNVDFKVNDFIAYLKQNSNSYFLLSTEVLNERLAAYEYSSLLAAEEKNLEHKHPEFKNLMREYRDGILLFEVSNNEVWEKASSDTEGLEKFFEANKVNYKWDSPRYKGYVVLAKDSKTKKKMQKEVSKMDTETAIAYLLENYKVGTVSYVRVEKGVFAKGDNAFVDQAIFKTSEKPTFPENFEDFFLLGKNLGVQPESYTDVRGMVITDYQDYLEKEWVDKLAAKYPIEVYSETLESIQW